ncbi:hypothetical protein ANCDUO_03446 [Ancylostoma duodenale]|uniref:Uncharacterized protein n=1 Tax=Ancylostoma duodenale TaxID=51022 RepID=A0A0C2H9N2_9BILA|nr:hypothetical protein ANCDUO_03446 [Ancylostoma duodenale]
MIPCFVVNCPSADFCFNNYVKRHHNGDDSVTITKSCGEPGKCFPNNDFDNGPCVVVTATTRPVGNPCVPPEAERRIVLQSVGRIALVLGDEVNSEKYPML